MPKPQPWWNDPKAVAGLRQTFAAAIKKANKYPNRKQVYTDKNWPSILSRSGPMTNLRAGKPQMGPPIPWWMDPRFSKGKKLPYGTPGGFHFNPNAKLDPSQIQDFRWLGKIDRAVRKSQDQIINARWPLSGKEAFPFLSQAQRMQMMADYAKWQPTQKRPDLYASSFPAWLGQMLDERRANRPRSIP
jgi:hypothetical protein